MAWVGQCRVAFKANADAILWRQKGKKNISKVLRQLSEESGIPLGTLKMWWYEQEKKKLENQPNTESQTKSKPSDNKLTTSDHPICTVCGERKVQRERRNGKWHYRDKCYKCRTIPTPAYQANAEINVLCPLCGGKFKLKKGDLTYEQNEN
jgi:hypothetical protein